MIFEVTLTHSGKPCCSVPQIDDWTVDRNRQPLDLDTLTMGRCALVFSKPGQILTCLETIAADSEVEVVRVNNKLARDYDADRTAGYRCAWRVRSGSCGAVSCAGWHFEVRHYLLVLTAVMTDLMHDALG